MSVLGSKTRIGEVLMEQGLLSQEQLDQALSDQTTTGNRLGDAAI